MFSLLQGKVYCVRKGQVVEGKRGHKSFYNTHQQLQNHIWLRFGAGIRQTTYKLLAIIIDTTKILRMTLLRMTLHRMTLLIMTLLGMTLLIMTLLIMTLLIVKLLIMTLFIITLLVLLNVITYSSK